MPVQAFHERQDPGAGHAQAFQVGPAQLAPAPGGQQFVDRWHAQAGHAQQQLARGGVEVDGKALAVGQGPGQLGVVLQRQHALAGGARGHQLAGLEAVEAHQPVGLVQPVLAHQRRGDQRQLGAGVGDGAERRVVDAAQAVAAVEAGAGEDDVAIVRRVGADDHLRAVPAGRKGWGPGRPRAACLGARDDGAAGRGLALGLGAADVLVQLAHALVDAGAAFLGRQLCQALHRGQLDVDAQAVGVQAGLGQQGRIGVGNGLEVDVAVKAMLQAQAAGHADQLFHGVVGAADDAAGQEQALDAVAPVEVERELHHLGHREAGARDVGADAVDAVLAVVEAEIGQQDLEQRHAAPIGRPAVADAHAGGRADAARLGRALGTAAGGAGSIVFGGVRQDGEFVLQVHCINIQLSTMFCT